MAIIARLRRQCQIECQIRGFEGIPGDKCVIKFRKLLIALGLVAGSSPSLTTIINGVYSGYMGNSFLESKGRQIEPVRAHQK
jgi:hypothetical protein